MFLKKVTILGFKNIKQCSLEFSSRVNCFVGDNGAGKTNLLDAINYLSMGRSAFSMTDLQSIRHGDDFYVLEAEYNGNGQKKECVICSCKRGAAKTLKRNGKEYDKLSDHIGLIPLVIVTPSDSMLITDAADERRRFMNSFLSQLDKAYLDAAMRYNRVLSERNRLLKQDSSGIDEVMEIFDMQLAEAGQIIHRKRQELILKLAPLVNEYYRILSDDREQIELHYHSELTETPFSDLLKKSYAKDRVLQFTSCGIHRDDLKMRIAGYQLRKYGSQGQQKSFLLALKLAQYNIVSQAVDKKPILLLDDLFDKLDTNRVEKLIGLVSRSDFGQIFITDCNKVRLEAILKKSGENFDLFNVDNGTVRQL